MHIQWDAMMADILWIFSSEMWDSRKFEAIQWKFHCLILNFRFLKMRPLPENLRNNVRVKYEWIQCSVQNYRGTVCNFQSIGTPCLIWGRCDGVHWIYASLIAIIAIQTATLVGHDLSVTLRKWRPRGTQSCELTTSLRERTQWAGRPAQANAMRMRST